MANSPDISAARFAELGLALPAPAAKERSELGQAEFFELMIAQLQQQDPLQPMESSEFMGQIAQFANVNGIQEMQQSINQMVGALQSSQALQASTLVGRDVLIGSDRGTLGAGAGLFGAADLPAATGELSVNIFDPAGRLVRTLELGSQAAGLARFVWDGIGNDGQPAPAGQYTVSATASIDGEPVALSTLIQARVESVTLRQNPPGATLNLGGLGAVDMQDVRQLL